MLNLKSLLDKITNKVGTLANMLDSSDISISSTIENIYPLGLEAYSRHSLENGIVDINKTYVNSTNYAGNWLHFTYKNGINVVYGSFAVNGAAISSSTRVGYQGGYGVKQIVNLPLASSFSSGLSSACSTADGAAVPSGRYVILADTPLSTVCGVIPYFHNTTTPSVDVELITAKNILSTTFFNIGIVIAYW